METKANAPGLGHNWLRFSGDIADLGSWLAGEYDALSDAVLAALDKAKELKPEVESDEDLGPYRAVFAEIRDLGKRIEKDRADAKAPYLSAGRSVDAFFKSFSDALTKANAGLLKRVNAYQQAKVEAERRERERIAAEEERKADEARRKANEARKAEEIAAREIEATVAGMRSDSAALATQAKAADMGRTRTEGGMVTMREEHFAEVFDYDALPLDVLRPHISRDALDKAVRAWARVTEHKIAMPGVNVGKREVAVIL